MQFRLALAFVLALVGADASGSPCGPPGTTGLFRQNDKMGYFLQRNFATRSLYLQFPGTSFTIDKRTPDFVNAFTLDGVYYQSLATKTDLFRNKRGPTTDAEVLARHAHWEVAAAKSSPSPLTRFEDLGNRVRPASRGTPELTFKLWRLYSPTDAGMSQYFLTTVVDEEVVVLSAIPSRAAGSKTAFLRTAGTYASAFHYLRANECQGR